MFLFFTNKLKVNPLFAWMTFYRSNTKRKGNPKFHNALLLGNSYRELRENPFLQTEKFENQIMLEIELLLFTFSKHKYFKRST